VTRLLLGLGLALASTLVLNWSFFAQHRASNTLPQLSLGHPLSSLRSLFTSGPWLLGYVAGLAGWGLYVAALVLAPISLVQAVSAGGVGLLALLVWRVAHQPLGRRDRTSVGCCFMGLALLGVSFAAGVPRPQAAGTTAVLAWVGVTLSVAAVCWVAGTRALRGGAGLGAAAGLLYAAGDVSTKAAVETSVYFVVLLIGCHLLGFVALQLAFQRGSALATAGLSNLLNNVVPIVAGVAAFHDGLPSGRFGILRVGAFAFVLLGAAMLARPEPEHQPLAVERADTPMATL
jgi:hypothetical protein